MKASSLTPKKREKQKFHISTAYKDNNKYTVYKREIKKKNRKNNLYLETLDNLQISCNYSCNCHMSVIHYLKFM